MLTMHLRNTESLVRSIIQTAPLRLRSYAINV
nr:MAG TPA: hypothetical protein [Caudoviricetes sp.]